MNAKEFYKQNEHWLAIIGLVSTVFAIPLAILLYLWSQSTSEISILTNQLQVLTESGKLSSVQVLDKNGVAIKSNIFAADAVIWNSGTVQLGNEAHVMREPLKIALESKTAKILDVTIQKSNVPERTTTIEQVGDRTVRVALDQFDPEDGLKLSVLYADDKISPLQFTGKFVNAKIVDRSGGLRTLGMPKIFGLEIWYFILPYPLFLLFLERMKNASLIASLKSYKKSTGDDIGSQLADDRMSKVAIKSRTLDVGMVLYLIALAVFIFLVRPINPPVF